MSKKLQIGIIGCGDFLRLQIQQLLESKRLSIKSVYDSDTKRADKYAAILSSAVAKSADEIINDPEIDIVGIFVPPWARKSLVLQSAKASKHILTTKPLGISIPDCHEMVEAVEGKVQCGVIYRRTGNLAVETLRKIFTEGDIGKPVLYKQDWIHHYPVWNKWATDPAKNGGPFMDAMIHNMNISCYLIDSPIKKYTYFSDNHVQHLKCNDTEFMKLDFMNGESAHLFITWAADLAIYNDDGNFREHINLFYIITDQGYRVTEEKIDDKAYIVATKDGLSRQWEVSALSDTYYDRFAQAIEKGSALPQDIPGIGEAYRDIEILKDAENQVHHALYNRA